MEFVDLEKSESTVRGGLSVYQPEIWELPNRETADSDLFWQNFYM